MALFIDNFFSPTLGVLNRQFRTDILETIWFLFSTISLRVSYAEKGNRLLLGPITMSTANRAATVQIIC